MGDRNHAWDAYNTDLVRRVKRLEDVETSREHAYRYAVELDAPTPESIAALFTEQGTLHTQLGEFTGRARVAGFYRERFAEDPSWKRHFVTNTRATQLERGLVEVSSHFLFTARGYESSVLGWGTYIDRVRVEDGVALFEHKTIDVHGTTRV